MVSKAQRRIANVIEKRVINPVVRRLLNAGLAPSAFALIETTGRKSGKKRQLPVGSGLTGDTF